MSKSRSRSSSNGPVKKGAEFIYRLRYKNDLPLVPFDPKLLAYPHPKDRHYCYKETSLLATRKFDLIHPDGEQGLGCNPLQLGFLEHELRNPNYLYQANTDSLDPEDKALLVPPVDKRATQKSANILSWQRRTLYVSNARSKYGKATSEIEPKAIKDSKVMERLDLSFENQVNFIKNSFDLAKKADLKSLKHPKNPELTATEIFPIFPDFEFWSTPYFLSTYDQDPINKSVLNLNPEDHVIALEESLLKPIRNNTENWLTYYAPTAASVEKLKRKRKLEDEDFVDDQEYELSFQKDFDQKIEPSSTYPFFLELREDQGGAFYSTINNHLKLRKRRALSKQDAYYEDEAQKHTRVLLTHRKLKAVEKQQRYARMKELIEVDGHEILAAYEEALLNDPEDLEENGDNDSPKQDIPITDELDL